MALESKKSRVTLFFVIGIGLSLLMALFKALIAWATHTYLYSVPWIGGFLRSIELTEISNLLIFAILGVGIGGATYLLPRRWDHRAKLAFLALVSPFVFSASYMMRQHLWIKTVASQSNLTYRDARDLTNDYLEREAGSRGFFGFYPFSTQLAELPTRSETLLAQQSLNPNELLSQELASYDDPRADLAAYWFERVGWLIRLMYMTIAALTALIYYFKGYAWAENRAYANHPSSEPLAEGHVKSEKNSPGRPHAAAHRKDANQKSLKNQSLKNQSLKNQSLKNQSLNTQAPNQKSASHQASRNNAANKKQRRTPQSTAAYPTLYKNDPLTKPSNPSSSPPQKSSQKPGQPAENPAKQQPKTQQPKTQQPKTQQPKTQQPKKTQPSKTRQPNSADQKPPNAS